ncbi:MAG TPA: GNAT family N-acetyltransferase [Candidatus Limnocylindrales bacterium]|nr:GNAT family N-acetyltransferase [Candidatus Limnocylindrales bacterium]
MPGGSDPSAAVETASSAADVPSGPGPGLAELAASSRQRLGGPADVAFRAYSGESDLPALVPLINDSLRHEGVEWVETPETLANHLMDPAHMDPARDIVLVESGGQLVAFARCAWHVELDGPRVYWSDCSVAPEHLRRGIGRVLLDACEARLRLTAAVHPEGPRQLAAWVDKLGPGRMALLEGAGYAPARYFFLMVRPTLEAIPEVPLPPGLEIRPAHPADLLRVARAEEEAFRDHWGHRSMDDADLQRMIDHPLTDPTLWRVAWDGDEVAGVVVGAINPAENEAFGRQRGWVDRVSTRRAWRKRGLASALIVEVLRALRERGMTSAQLGVDAENLTGALALYERLGFVVDQRSASYRKPMEPEAA